MKRIYDSGRSPAQRNYTVADLKALKGSGKTLSMCNPANATEIQACVDAECIAAEVPEAFDKES